MASFFEPIIGSGFDSVAGQRQFWGAQNLQTESANLARARDAQQAVNNWLAQAAQMQQSAAERDAATAVALSRDAQSQRNFLAQMAENRQEWQERLKEERHRTDTTLKWHDEAIKAQTKANQDTLETIANMGAALAPDADSYGAAYEKAQAELTKAANESNAAMSKIGKQYAGKAVFDPRTKMFKVDPTIPIKDKKARTEAQTAVDAANDALLDAQNSYTSAQVKYEAAAKGFQDFQKQISANGLVLTKKGGKWAIYSPRHDQFWGGAQEAPATETKTETPGKKFTYNPQTGTVEPAGGTETAPPAPPAAAPAAPGKPTGFFDTEAASPLPIPTTPPPAVPAPAPVPAPARTSFFNPTPQLDFGSAARVMRTLPTAPLLKNIPAPVTSMTGGAPGPNINLGLSAPAAPVSSFNAAPPAPMFSAPTPKAAPTGPDPNSALTLYKAGRISKSQANDFIDAFNQALKPGFFGAKTTFSKLPATFPEWHPPTDVRMTERTQQFFPAYDTGTGRGEWRETVDTGPVSAYE